MNKTLSSLIVLVALGQTALAADRPNILFIMADDHTYQAIGAYGSRLAKLNPTPAIDSLKSTIVEGEACSIWGWG